MSHRHRILLTQPLDDESERKLQSAAEVVRPGSVDEAEICRSAADCDAMIVRTAAPITASILEAAPRLRVIGVAAAGLDHVDLAAAAARGVLVLHKPEAASDAVAEFAVALMLQLLRPTARLAADYAAGKFAAARRIPHGPELKDLTVGIVGMGRIGTRVAKICSAGFGATVIYNDLVDVGPFPFETRSAEKTEVWNSADIISLHLPLTDLTRGLIDDQVLGQLRPHLVLINTARGKIIDTDALVDALRDARIGGAALDVTDPEPLPPEHALRQFDHCILTPHVASRTHAGLRRMFSIVDDVLAFIADDGDDAPHD